jgi:hypothetical protein
MKIPEVRTKMQEIVDELVAMDHEAIAERLAELIYELYRRPSIHRSGPKAVPMSPLVRERILNIYSQNPTMLHREIGRAVGVDGGRVSEVIRGKRK